MIDELQYMFFKKYKFLKNNGLLPKIDHPKFENILTSYCLINDKKQHQYTLVRSASDGNTLIIFNDKQYLHRKCSYITAQNSSSKIVTEVSSLYPKHNHTLTIFIANAPQQCNQVLLGNKSASSNSKNTQSLLGLAYKNVCLNKTEGSVVRLSIMGIQTENSLTDELNLEWLDQYQAQEEFTPLEIVIRSKQKVRVIKQNQGTAYHTQNLTHHDIGSQSKLRQILEKYRDAKTYLQDWIISNSSAQFYLLGELYHIAQIKPISQDNSQQIILQSHYTLRVNQYFRMASSLMLRLGIHLRKAEVENSKTMEMHESKLFKLLSECFSGSSRNGKGYRFHLFLQVGEYATLKDEYLCLVPTSQYLHKNHVSSVSNILQSDFFYTKQIMEYPELHSLINSLANNQKQDKGNTTILPQISEILKARLKTKSYVCDTYSSQEKRIGKYRHLITEQIYDRSHMDLEQLVYEAAKIYRLPSPKRNPTIIIKQNFSHLKKPRKNASLFERSRESVQKQKETNFQKRRKQENIVYSKKDQQKGKFYEQTKQWLGLIYGKNSSKKLLSNKRMQRFDENTNVLIQDMLTKEISRAEEQQIDEAIDRL